MQVNHELNSTDVVQRPKYFRDLEVSDMEILAKLEINRYKVRIAQVYLEEFGDFVIGPIGFAIFPHDIKPFLTRIIRDSRLLVTYASYSGARSLNLKNARYRENLILERLCSIPKLVADALGCDLDETGAQLKPWTYPHIIDQNHPVFRKGSGVEITLRLCQESIEELILKNEELERIRQIGTVYLEPTQDGLYYAAKSDYISADEMVRYVRVFVGLDKRRNSTPYDFKREYLTWLNSQFPEA